MQFALLCAAIFLFVVKIASTIWLVRQPDATIVTSHLRGRAIYYASKLSPILFVAAMLARTCLQGGPPAYVAFWAVLLAVATVMAVVVIRQRAAGEWYGYAHEIKQSRHRRRDP